MTGLGMVSPAGIGVAASWPRIVRGEPTATPDPALAGLPVDFSCRVPDFDPTELLNPRTVWRQSRCTQLALLAAGEAIADAGLDHRTWDATRVGVVIGNCLGGTATFEQQHGALHEQGTDAVTPLLIPLIGQSSPSGGIAIEFNAKGPSWSVGAACASGSLALGSARELLRQGLCDVVIAGGTESALSPTIVTGFARMGALSTRRSDPGAASRPFDVDRDGFVSAEGAGVVVLERAEDAVARRAHVHARISGYAMTTDSYHISAPRPDGAEVERAVREALADAGVGVSDVDHVNAHGTSTKLNDLNESAVLRRVLGDRPAVTSVKGALGHSLAAAGAIETVCTVLSVEHGVVPATANLDSQDPEIDLDLVAKVPREIPVRAAINNSFGFGGANTVVVVTG
ncbi:3-oxoacyl-ACP synthase [Actinophytocola xinjiangensis]|uniref:3-oxoacyl-ACP synthase n=1 Tax=Actinophytocola xinjiangensis TaxID=485602 RepID=A0A7Z0WTB6_9PSEU|nr:3-oxoacyl-ACP synthase [Actinophytocola xinjiangensis]